MVLDPIPQSLPVHFFGSRPQPPTSRAVFDVFLHEMECIFKWNLLIMYLHGRAHEFAGAEMFHGFVTN